MRNPLAYLVETPAATSLERRTRGRVLQQGVVCSLGIVLDLSAGGMRILSTRSYQGVLEVNVRTEYDQVIVQGEIMWSRRAGFRRHLVGLQFLNMQGETREQLARIASSHRMHRVL